MNRKLKATLITAAFFAGAGLIVAYINWAIDHESFLAVAIPLAAVLVAWVWFMTYIGLTD